MMPRVKICCIRSVEEAWMSSMPSGPGVISEERIAEIAEAVPLPIATFLLTCAQDARTVIEQQRRCGTNTIQLCDGIDHDAYAEVRSELPGIALVQVVHVSGEESIAEARAAAPFVDAILLESGNQKAAVKELGGTGRTHDWRISRKIREAVGVPVYLAGGLRPENVAQAIEAVQPFAVDLCSGVRTDGELDEGKLRRFFAMLGR